MKYRVFQFQRKNTLRPIYICIWAKYNRIIQFEAINKLLCCFCTKLSVMIHLIYNLNCRITSLKIKDNKHPSHKYFLYSGKKVFCAFAIFCKIGKMGNAIWKLQPLLIFDGLLFPPFCFMSSKCRDLNKLQNLSQSSILYFQVFHFVSDTSMIYPFREVDQYVFYKCVISFFPPPWYYWRMEVKCPDKKLYLGET